MGDGIVGITWTPVLGVSYLTFGSTNPSVSTLNWTDPAIAGFALLNNGTSTTPPALLCNSVPGAAVNGQPYYFTVDAHSGTSPSGGGSPTMMAVGRSAGGNGTWRAGTPMGANLNGIGYASIEPCLSNALPNGIWATVGPVGAIFTSTDGKTWTSHAPATYSANLFAVAATAIPNTFPNPPTPLFVAVGEGSSVVRSTDGIAWSATVAANPALPALRAIAVASGGFVAVGDNGRIQSSPDGVNWALRASNTGLNLHAVTCFVATCVAAGDGGILLASFDAGTTWGQTTLGTGASTLRAIAYGNFDNNQTATNVVGVGGNTEINTWVVVGDGGAVFESNTLIAPTSPVLWNPVVVSGAGNFVSVAYTTQFVAVDNSGNAFTSQTAVSWSPPIATGIADPVWMATNSHGFVLAGSSGDNASSF